MLLRRAKHLLKRERKRNDERTVWANCRATHFCSLPTRTLLPSVRTCMHSRVPTRVVTGAATRKHRHKQVIVCDSRKR